MILPASSASSLDLGIDVKVKKVNTLRQPGKRKRLGATAGMTRGYKKAIVVLYPGHKIDIY